MFKKIRLTVFVCIVLTANYVFAGASAELEQAKSNIVFLIEQANYAEAQVQTQKLIASYPEHPDLPETLLWIAEAYFWSGKHDQAKEMHQQIIQSFPGSSTARKAQLAYSRTEVLSLIGSNKLEQAEGALDKLVSDFSGHPDLPETLYWIAEGYKWSGAHDQAKRVHQQVIQNYPDSSWAGKAKLGISMTNALSLIVSRDYSQAEEAVNKLVSDFSGHQDLPETLYRIADGYFWSGNYDRAENWHQYVIQNFPDSPQADNSKLAYAKTEVLSLLDSNELEQAEEALDKLAADFAGHLDLPETLFRIAEAYFWSGKHDQAKNWHQYVIQNFPGSPQANNSKLAYARTEVLFLLDSNELEQADEALDRLVIDFAGHPDLPQTLCWIAEGYEWSGRYEQAESVYQQVIQNYPDSSWVGKARLGISSIDVMSLIMSGDYSQAEAAVDKLAADFSGHPDLPGVLSSFIAERLYDKAFEMDSAGLENQSKAYFQKAVEIWEQVSAIQPKLTNTADGCNWAGNCYRRLGKYEKAIDCYKNVVEKFPDYNLAWNALFKVGRCYEDMEKAGAIGESEAKPKIRIAYEQLVEKYPDCKAAKIARSWLDKNREQTETGPFMRSN